MDCIVNTVHWPVSEKGMLKMDCILSLQCIVRMDVSEIVEYYRMHVVAIMSKILLTQRR